MSVRREHEGLVVITETYDLILWSCHHTGKFPRNHRFVLRVGQLTKVPGGGAVAATPAEASE
jgi:hypothetical protein